MHMKWWGVSKNEINEEEKWSYKRRVLHTPHTHTHSHENNITSRFHSLCCLFSGGNWVRACKSAAYILYSSRSFCDTCIKCIFFRRMTRRGGEEQKTECTCFSTWASTHRTIVSGSDAVHICIMRYTYRLQHRHTNGKGCSRERNHFFFGSFSLYGSWATRQTAEILRFYNRNYGKFIQISFSRISIHELWIHRFSEH